MIDDPSEVAVPPVAAKSAFNPFAELSSPLKSPGNDSGHYNHTFTFAFSNTAIETPSVSADTQANSLFPIDAASTNPFSTS